VGLRASLVTSTRINAMPRMPGTVSTTGSLSSPWRWRATNASQ
jgi:hypothetical protein